MADGALGLNPDRVNKFLQDELNGTAPQEVVDFVNRMRKEKPGMFPPPIFPAGAPRVNVSGKVQPRPKDTLPAPPDPDSLNVGSGRRLGFMPTMSETTGTAKAVGKSLLDPESIGGIAGAYGGGEIGMPSIGAGVGAAAGNVVKQVYQGVVNPKPGYMIDPAPVAAAFGTGLIGEKVASGANSLLSRAPRTAAGEAVSNFMGKDTMAQQMTDSPMLDFAANVARYGPGGRSIMEDAEKAQSQRVLDGLKRTAEFANQGKATTVDPLSGELDLGQAGQNVQRDIQGNIKNMKANSGYQSFLATHGDAQELRQVGINAETGQPIMEKGPKVSQLHEQRSAALKSGREAFAADDLKAQSDALASASKASDAINRALPDQAARDEYRAIADKYNFEINRLDNPTALTVRKGKSNDVIDNIIDSKLKNYASMKTGTGHSNVQLLGKIEDAVSPEAWNQLQADTIHRLGERATGKEGLVEVDKFKELLDNIDEPTKRKLFGNSLSDLNTTLSIMQQAANYTKSQAGRLFIAIRTGQAGIRIASEIGSVAAGAAVGAGANKARGGSPITGGAVGAATVLVSPYAFAKLLTSPVGRTLLTKAAKGGMTQTAIEQTKKALLRFGAQKVAEDTREAVVPSKYERPDDINPIPEPPR